MRKNGSLLAHLLFQKRVRSKNIFSIIWRKMFPVHRRTKSRPETVSYHLFNFHILVLQLNIFDCVILECFDSVPLWPRTVMFIWDYSPLKARWWLTRVNWCGLAKWTSSLREPIRAHIIQMLIYSGFHYFAELSKGSFLIFEPDSLI